MPKKILLVDDSATVLMMERMILSQGRYELLQAKNGKEAVEKAKRDRPDLILMDVVMPELDGFGALAALRGDDVTRDIPIIMVTTRSEASSMETGFARGCNDYVTKPVNSAELLAKVRNLLGE
jgi:PleD family two-component response regulator